jgi:hypothetical protein
MCLIASGCASERNRDVPSDAKIVAQGEKTLTYRAPEEGTIYVYDKNGNNVLYSGRLQRDEMVQVDAMRDKILVDGRTVMDKQIRDHDQINVFFRREPLRESVLEARPAESTIIREREVRTEPRSSSRSSDSTITVHPDRDKVTVEGNSDAKVTVQQPDSDSKVTIERGSGSK